MQTIASGMRLTPARLNPHRCIVTRSASQSIGTSGSGTAISWASATVNADGLWVTGTTVTILEPGTYAFAAATTFAAGSTGVRAINVQRNGVVLAEQKRAANNQADPVAVSVADMCAAGDQITAVAYHTQGSSLAITNSTLSVIQTGGA